MTWRVEFTVRVSSMNLRNPFSGWTGMMSKGMRRFGSVVERTTFLSWASNMARLSSFR